MGFKLDVDLMNKKGVSRFETQEGVDITLLLPEKFTDHTEASAGVKELYVEDLRLERLEYDGNARNVISTSGIFSELILELGD